MPYKHKIHKREELISIVVTMLFVAGFIILANYDVSITGYAVENVSISDGFGIEDIPSYGEAFILKNSTDDEIAVFYDTGRLTIAGTCTSGGSCDSPPADSFIIQDSSEDNNSYIDPSGNLCIETGDCEDKSASCTPPADSFIIQNSTGNVSYIDSTGDLCLTGELIEGYSTGLIVNNILPINYTNSSTYYINFTYNVVTDQTHIENCSLYLLKNGIWEQNKTNSSAITQVINQSINITYLEDGSYLWKVGCYDDTNNQGNSSSYNLTLDAVAPLVNLHEPADAAIDTDGEVSYIYNVSDNMAIANCSLYTNTSTTEFTVKDTDISIIKEINQNIDVTYTTSETINWKIGCWNIYNKQGNSSTRQLIIRLPITEEEVVPVKGGSSSGTGLSGERTSSLVTETIQTIRGNVYLIDKLSPGETELKIINPGLAVTSILLDSAKEAENVEVVIEETRNTRLEKPDRRTYRYINIDTDLPESFINKINILFKIQKKWGNDIKLLRYKGYWQELQTEKIDEDQYYEYYKAVSPGFSAFAITAEKIIGIEKIKEEIEKVAKEIVEKPTKLEIWAFAILPVIALSLAALVLLHYLVKLVKKHKKITFGAVLSGLGVIIFITPFTNEVLYWAILPLSIIFVSLLLTVLLINHYKPAIFKEVTNIFKLLVKIKPKTYIILLLIIGITGLILIIKFGSITGYTVIPSSVKSDLNSIITLILISLSVGVYFLEKWFFKKG